MQTTTAHFALTHHSFARLPAAIDQSGLSRSTIYDLVQRGLFPPLVD